MNRNGVFLNPGGTKKDENRNWVVAANVETIKARRIRRGSSSSASDFALRGATWYRCDGLLLNALAGSTRHVTTNATAHFIIMVMKVKPFYGVGFLLLLFSNFALKRKRLANARHNHHPSIIHHHHITHRHQRR